MKHPFAYKLQQSAFSRPSGGAYSVPLVTLAGFRCLRQSETKGGGRKGRGDEEKRVLSVPYSEIVRGPWPFERLKRIRINVSDRTINVLLYFVVV